MTDEPKRTPEYERLLVKRIFLMNMIGCELIRVLGLSDYHLLKANRFWLGHELEKFRGFN